MKRFRYEYGASPVHLLAALAAFAIAAWALVQVLEVLASPGNFLIWLVGAVIVHDLILLPFYSALGALAGGALGVLGEAPTRLRIAALNHLRIPALLSGLLLLVWFPLVLQLDEATFTRNSGLGNDVYLERWLALTAVMFITSAVLLAVRARSLRGAS